MTLSSYLKFFSRPEKVPGIKRFILNINLIILIYFISGFVYAGNIKERKITTVKVQTKQEDKKVVKPQKKVTEKMPAKKIIGPNIDVSEDGTVIRTPYIIFKISPQTGAWEVTDRLAKVTWNSNIFFERFGEVIYRKNTLPPEIDGLEGIRTSQKDKEEKKQNPFLSFEIAGDATVYIALDERVPVPSWMRTKRFLWTGMNISSEQDGRERIYNLYALAYKKGKVELGPNEAPTSDSNMYFVLVKPKKRGEQVITDISRPDYKWDVFHAGSRMYVDSGNIPEETATIEGQRFRVSLSKCKTRKIKDGTILRFENIGGDKNTWIEVTVKVLADERTLVFSYEKSENGLDICGVKLLDDAFSILKREKGYIILPLRMGILIPCDSGLTYNYRFDNEGEAKLSMQMIGLIKSSATVLIWWNSPYVEPEVRSMAGRKIPWGQVLSTSIVLRKSANSFRVRFCGIGNPVSLANTYRSVAINTALPVTYEEKIKEVPLRYKLAGAINFKLWSCLSRKMNEESNKEISVNVNWTFDEVQKVAEHLKYDLQIDKVLFTIGGWIRRGYDNQHPDILPPAPELGGEKGLSKCSKAVMQLGYLFCLHDNYHDIYRDSPSWNENLIRKDISGNLVKGGIWAGGQAYILCSKKAVELAARPQNLPMVKSITGANAYFNDVTYAHPPIECHDREHPLTREDDIKWRNMLSIYTRKIFGVFGSEDGFEWGIPYCDFFEGITGVKGTYFNNWSGYPQMHERFGGVPLPIFDFVYRDCIIAYGKYGYEITKSAEYVLYHISLGRALNYHDVPRHLYWKKEEKVEEVPLPLKPDSPDEAVFTRGHNGWTEGLHIFDRFLKNTYEILSPLSEMTAFMRIDSFNFIDSERLVRRVVFRRGIKKVEVITNFKKKVFIWKDKDGNEIILPPYGFFVSSDEFIAFYAFSYNGIKYSQPVLWTVRSMENTPIQTAKRLRIYHGFGEERIKIGDKIFNVKKDLIFESQ